MMVIFSSNRGRVQYSLEQDDAARLNCQYMSHTYALFDLFIETRTGQSLAFPFHFFFSPRFLLILSSQFCFYLMYYLISRFTPFLSRIAGSLYTNHGLVMTQVTLNSHGKNDDRRNGQGQFLFLHLCNIPTWGTGQETLQPFRPNAHTSQHHKINLQKLK